MESTTVYSSWNSKVQILFFPPARVFILPAGRRAAAAAHGTGGHGRRRAAAAPGGYTGLGKYAMDFTLRQLPNGVARPNKGDILVAAAGRRLAVQVTPGCQ
jgi:hypothetical protein